MDTGGEFEGWGVVVTGGAGVLGSAAARRFAQLGARVVVSDRDGAAAREVAGAIDAGGRRALGLACDVGDARACDDLVAAAEAFLGAPIDVFLANAGASHAGTLGDASIEDIERVVRVNVLGTLYSARAALRSLVRSPRASLLLTGSLQGVTARARRTLYTTTKHAIVGLTRSLALDYGPLGVRVNAIAPAATDTPFLRDLLREDGGDVEAGLRRVAAGLPLQRLPTAEDFAEAACFVASPRARSISGHNLLLDAGAAAGLYSRPPSNP